MTLDKEFLTKYHWLNPNKNIFNLVLVCPTSTKTFSIHLQPIHSRSDILAQPRPWHPWLGHHWPNLISTRTFLVWPLSKHLSLRYLLLNLEQDFFNLVLIKAFSSYRVNPNLYPSLNLKMYAHDLFKKNTYIWLHKIN